MTPSHERRPLRMGDPAEASGRCRATGYVHAPRNLKCSAVFRRLAGACDASVNARIIGPPCNKSAPRWAVSFLPLTPSKGQ